MSRDSRVWWLVCGLILLFGLIACGAKPTSAGLTALRELVKVRHPADVSHAEVAVGSRTAVGTGDEIKLEEQGHAELRFPDALQVDLELLGGTELQVRYLPPSNQDPVARLFLASGTTWQSLQGEVDRRVVRTETPSAVVIAQGTEYVVSVDESQTTWVVGFEGQVIVEAQNEQVVVAAGQATWVRLGEPPQSPVPVDLDAVARWLDGLRAGELTPIEPVVLPPPPEVAAETPEATEPTTATAEPACKVVTRLLSLRQGPGLDYPIGATLTPGETVRPLSRNAEVTWLRVQTRPGDVGWVSSDPRVVGCNLDLEQLPVEPEIPPPPPAEPFIDFRADRTRIEAGECATLAWDVENVIAVYLDDEEVVSHDRREVCPEQTQTYTLRAVTATGEEVRQVPIVVVTVWTWNISPDQPPFDDVRLRQATAFAVDVETINRAVFPDGNGRLIQGDPALNELPHDPEKAKELLAEAGYDGQKVFIVGEGDVGTRIAEYLAEYLSAVGFRAQVPGGGAFLNPTIWVEPQIPGGTF
jgi:hypothetical protein